MTLLPESVRRRLAAEPAEAANFSALHSSADMLSAFAEDRLSPQERARLMEHLSMCADCRQVVWHVLPELGAPDATAQLAPVRWAFRSPWLGSPAFRWSAIAACLIVAGGIALFQRDVLQHHQIAADQRPAVLERPMQRESAPKTDSSDGTAPAAVAAMLEPSSPVSAKHNPAASTNIPPRAQPAVNMPLHANAFMGSKVTASSLNADLSGKIFPRWTLTSDGLLQRSLDAGKSWQPIVIPGNSSTLHAIAAQGTHVWVGGAAGVLYHSSDAGKDWSQVKPSDGGKTLADDVIGIEFSSVQMGKLITGRQETWTTADGGNTWQKK